MNQEVEPPPLKGVGLSGWIEKLQARVSDGLCEVVEREARVFGPSADEDSYSNFLLFSYRFECHSLIVKSLRKMGLLDANIKDVRLNFIFTNSSGLNDAFYCEDKPYERASKDNKKTRHLRKQALNYWVSLLSYNECIEHITAVACQFNKLTLQIAATKFIAGVTVRSALREVRIPNNDQEGASEDIVISPNN